MTEKRYVEELWAYDDIMVKDNENGEELWNNMIYERMNEQDKRIKELEKENKDKPFFKIVDDYLIEYDGDYFDLHKPSDIRSLIHIINRANGYSELQ